MAFIDDDNVPSFGLQDTVPVFSVNCTMDATYNSWIRQSSISIPTGPLSKGQVQAFEFATDIAHQASRSKIQNAQARIAFQQLFKEQTGFDRLS